MLALARDTGWTEDHILHRMPVARLFAYQHQQLIDSGCETLDPRAADRAWERLQAANNG